MPVKREASSPQAPQATVAEWGVQFRCKHQTRDGAATAQPPSQTFSKLCSASVQLMKKQFAPGFSNHLKYCPHASQHLYHVLRTVRTTMLAPTVPAG